MTNPCRPVIRLERVAKEYRKGAETVRALRGIDLRIDRPPTLLADEPAGDLDARAGGRILRLLIPPRAGPDDRDRESRAGLRRVVRPRDGRVESVAANAGAAPEGPQAACRLYNGR